MNSNRHMSSDNHSLGGMSSNHTLHTNN